MRTSISILSLSFLFACGAEGPERAEVLENYANLVKANYDESLSTAKTLQSAVDAFVDSPSEVNFQAAKDAWLAARRPYGQTEAFRFYAGPIDNAEGPEGQLNAWPLDEAYIDYVDTASTSGIINDTSIELTPARLMSLNEGGEGDIINRAGGTFDAEAAVATGYHAVEFLLWGQDMSATGPGERPWQDYLTDMNATSPNGDRRGQYLKTAAQIIVDDLETMVQAWDPDTSSNYRNTTFLAAANQDDMLRNIIGAIGILSKGELASERMDVALDTNDQEDEHSCFSDNTHVDIEMNAQGIQNVYLGRYGSVSGPSIYDLVAANDQALADEISSKMEASLTSIRDMPKPFDQAISTPMSDGWNKVNEAVNLLFDQGDRISAIGPALELGNINIELPE